MVKPWKHPHRSKERGDLWNENSSQFLNWLLFKNSSDHPKFKVSKRSVRDRLTLLQQKCKAKMRMEEAASGIDCVRRNHREREGGHGCEKPTK